MVVIMVQRNIIYVVDKMNIYQRKSKGFTLLEMILVIAIMGMILVAMSKYAVIKVDQLKRDRMALQIQQIENAAMAYYVSTGTWPGTTAGVACGTAATNLSSSILISSNYLPASMIKSPYGTSYKYSCPTLNSSPLAAYLVSSGTVGAITGPASAQIIASMVPGGYVSNYPLASDPKNGVNSQVIVPGQNLNNARSVNFAGIYKSGACVPAPTCPLGMSPTILVTPAAVSGVNDAPVTCTSATDPSTCTNVVVNPVSSFTAFARGNSSALPDVDPNVLDCEVVNTPQTAKCSDATMTPPAGGTNAYASVSATDPVGTTYWRVCLSVITQKGRVIVKPTTTDATPVPIPYAFNQGRLMGSILAITRCAPTTGDSPSGSPISVWTPNKNWNP